MKRIGIILGGLFVVIIGAAIAAPFIVDANQYKDQIEEIASDTLGRDVVISGDVDLGLITGPKVNIAGLSIANDPRSEGADLLTLETASVHIAVLPLLSGKVQVTQVKLVGANLSLVQFADGSTNLPNLSQQTADQSPADIAPPASSETGDSSFAIAVDDLLIEQAMITVNDHSTGAVQTVTIPTLALSLASLEGPFDAKGQINYGALSIMVEASLGSIAQDTTRVRGYAKIVDSDALALLTAEVSGALTDLKSAPAFDGQVNATVGQDAALLALPTVKANSERVTVAGGTVNLGDTKADIDITASLGDVPDIVFALKAGKVDLAKLLESAGALQQLAGKLPQSTSGAQASSTPAGQVQIGFDDNPLPTNINVDFDVDIDALAMNGDAVRQMKFAGALKNGKLNLRQGSAKLPGAGQVTMTMASSHTNGLGASGDVVFSINDLSHFARWLDVELPTDARSETYQRASGNVPFIVRADGVRLGNMTVKLDRSTLTGTVLYDMRQTPAALSYRLAVDRLDADAYMADDSTATETTATTQSTDSASSGAKFALPLSIEGQLAIGELIYGGTSYHNVSLQKDIAPVDGGVKAAISAKIAPYTIGLVGQYNASLGQAQLDRFDFGAGRSRLSGTALVTGLLGGGRPNFKAALSGPYLNMDEVMPKASDNRSEAQIQSGTGSQERWSKDPINFAPLRDIDGTFALAIDRFIGFGLDATDLKGDVVLKDGVFDISDFSGALFGGDMKANGKVDARQDRAIMDIDILARDFELQQVQFSFLKKGRFAGLVNGALDLTTSGASMFDLVSGLQGDIKLDGKKGALRGMDLRRFASSIRNFEKGGAATVVASLTSGETTFRDMTAWYVFDKGVMTTRNIIVNVGSDVDIKPDMTLDLPNWHADFVTRIRLAERDDYPPVDLVSKGAPDNLRTQIDTSAVQQYYVNRFINKGVEKLFNGGFKF